MPTFIAESTWPNITSNGVQGSYIDVDLDSYGAPADVAGVTITFKSNSGTDNPVMCYARKNGSTDSGEMPFERFREYAGTYHTKHVTVGCDANHVIELLLYSPGVMVSAYISAWWHEKDAEFYTNAVECTRLTTYAMNTWITEREPSAPAGTKGIILLSALDGNTSEDYDVRVKGSSFDHTLRIDHGRSSKTWIQGVDANRDFEFNCDEANATSIQNYSLGYVKDGFQYVDPPEFAFSNASRNVWGVMSPAGLPADAYGIQLVGFAESAGERHGVRRVGDTVTQEFAQTACYHGPDYHMTALDASQDFEMVTRYGNNKPERTGVTGYFFPFTSDHILTSLDLRNTGTLTDSSVTVTHALSSLALRNTGTVEDGAVSTTHSLSSASLRNTGTVEGGAITSTHVLGALSLRNNGTVEGGAITSTHVLGALSLRNTGTVGDGTVGVTHVLSSLSLRSVGTVKDGGISTTHILSSASLRSSGTVEGDAVTSTHVLISTNLASTGAVAAAAAVSPNVLTTLDLRSTGVLTPAAVSVSHVLSPVSLSTSAVLAPLVVTSEHTMESVPLSAPSTLPPVSVAVRHVLGALYLRNTGHLTTGAVVHTHAMAALALVNAGFLTDGSIGQTHAVGSEGTGATGHLTTGAVDLPLGITAVLAVETNATPAFWGEETKALGRFSVQQGQVWVGDEEATVNSWTASEVRFVAASAARPEGNYDVHVDVVI